MSDLSRWDLVDSFSAKEAACLALGFDPNDPNAPAWKIEPIVRAMRKHYEMCAAFVVINRRTDPTDPDGVKVEISRPAADLIGKKLMFQWLSSEAGSVCQDHAEEIHRLTLWFESEQFLRSQLTKYFAGVGIEPKYRFDATQRESDGAKVNEPRIERPASIIETRINRLFEIARQLGYEPPQLPARDGKSPGPKAKIKDLALREPALFTESTFQAAWEKSGLKDGGVRRP